jgi:hypothetical protein
MAVSAIKMKFGVLMLKNESKRPWVRIFVARLIIFHIKYHKYVKSVLQSAKPTNKQRENDDFH